MVNVNKSDYEFVCLIIFDIDIYLIFQFYYPLFKNAARNWLYYALDGFVVSRGL